MKEENNIVLLTGAGGSIGVHFIAHIMHNTDWDVIAIDSFEHKGEFDRITEVCKEHPDWPGRIKVLAHDLNAPFSDREISDLSSVDYIINLASLSDVQASIDDPVPFIKNNTNIILNILELARAIKPDVFLHFSTDEVYGPAVLEWEECREEVCPDDAKPLGKRDHKHQYAKGHPEWSTILPSNPYAASKAAQEAIAISYWRSFGVPLIITNTMNNFGEMQQRNKYPVKIQKAIQNGDTIDVHTASDGQIGTRYYLHSRNAADAVLFIINNTIPYLHQAGQLDRPDRYNVVGDTLLDNLQLVKEIADLMEEEPKYRLVDFHSEQPGHDLHYGLDGSSLKKMGWKQPLGFKESMKNTIKWQQQNKKWIE